MYEVLEDKYIDLLVNRCLNLNKSKALFIKYPYVLKKFVEKIVLKAKEKGINDIYLDEKDVYKIHEKLKTIKLEDIKNDKDFDESIWNEYAKKNSAFLMISSIFPHLNDDVDPKIIAEVTRVSLETRQVYRKMQANNEISWCIAVMPNVAWAKDRFPNLSEEEAYQKLFNLMMDATMVNTDSPIDSWNKFLLNQKSIADKLNSLNITKLYYKNKLGTDLEITLSSEALWNTAGYDNSDEIVNMPTYEVFTSPDKRYTNGVVYASKPLNYNGVEINDFWIKFKDGKVIDFDAKTGKEVLKSIIESDKQANMLGEVALVSKNSAIAKMNFTFGETCLDENASCHIALGAGFPDCIKNGLKKTPEELDELGLNKSKNHVDFMIGTDDLCITAETNVGNIEIFKDGDFNLKN